MRQIQRFMGYCLALRERRASGQQAVFTSLGIRKLLAAFAASSSLALSLLNFANRPACLQFVTQPASATADGAAKPFVTHV